MKPLKIMICGRRKRGKDTLADCIQQIAVPLKVARGSFAKALKYDLAGMLSEYHDIPLTAEETIQNRDVYGPLWQTYGEWCRQYFGADYWVQQFDADNYGEKHIVVADCRHPNEVEYGRKHGYTIVRVEGPYRGGAQDTRSDNHPSEAHVDTLDVDLVVQNTGTIADLYRWAEEHLFHDTNTVAS